MKPYPFNIGNPTAARLQIYRDRAEAWNTAYPTKRTWKQFRYEGLTASNPVTENGKVFTENKEEIGIYLGDAATFDRQTHTGWYSTNDGSSMLIGGVAKLRCPKGTLYIPVTHGTGFDGATHYLKDAELVPKGTNDPVDAIIQAARTADRHAEIEAEQGREDDAKYQAEQQIEEAKEQVNALHAEARTLIAAIREQTLPPTICKRLTRDLKAMRAACAEQWQLIRERESNFWTAVN